MDNILGKSEEISRILRSLPLIATSDASVLLSGETGTGKDLVARAIHEQSRRSVDKNIKTINCAALPREDVEVELFGCCDAEGNIVTKGRLLEAEGTTLFLDEVDALPLSAQIKILRFLETGECQLKGSNHNHLVDVRIIAATSADLAHEVEAGRFRSDLYYRLNVLPISLPALRDRSSDIVLLLKHFFKTFSGKNAVVRLSREVEVLLQQYTWPGNIRELKNFCHRTALLQPGVLLQEADLPELMRQRQSVQPAFKLPSMGLDLAKVELEFIEQALVNASGNRSKASRLLGISRDTLLYRMQKHGIS